MNPRHVIHLFALGITILAAAVVADAQGTTSRVTGTVQDVNGAAIVGANVSLTNDGTGIVFSTETSQSGAYTFDLVQIGNYSLTVEKQGFKKFLSKGNVV